MKKLAIKYDYLIFGLIAFSYYLILCAKQWTWVFTSSDSGDWLASSIWWFNSQPFGSPLYVLLGHLMNFLFHDHLVLAMTIGLSVIPASITVAITYLIIKKLTKIRYAIIGSILLLASVVFLSQSTVIEEYAISGMFVALAYYFYISDKKKLTILMLALGTAVHSIVGLISLIWFLCHITRLKQWYKTFWIFFVFGVLPYSLVLVLMAMDNPKILAGNLSMASISNYLGTTGTIGSISWYEALKRILPFIGFICLTLGLGIIPFIRMFKKFYTKRIQIALVTIVTCIWLYVTDNDPNAWTFLYFSIPLMIVLAVLGLRYFNKFHTKFVTSFAIVMILFNSFYMNANVLTEKYSLAVPFEKAAIELPDHSAILNLMSGGYLLGILRVMSEDKDIIPLCFSGDIPDSNDPYSTRYISYKAWLERQYDITGATTQELVSSALNKHINVYVIKGQPTEEWNKLFEFRQYNNIFDQVVGVK